MPVHKWPDDLALERIAVDRCLAHLLRAEKGIPRRLKSALGHSLLGGGKRLRPRRQARYDRRDTFAG